MPIAPTEVTTVHLAGTNAVAELKGALTTHRATPCPGCPWRRENVGNFHPEAFKINAPVAYDQAMHVFACHESGATKKPTACAGFLLVESERNLAVKVQEIEGNYDRTRLDAAGADLYGSYREMAIDNGVPADAPEIAPCRADDAPA